MHLGEDSNFLYCRLIKMFFFFLDWIFRGQNSLLFDGDYVHYYDNSLECTLRMLKYTRRKKEERMT